MSGKNPVNDKRNFRGIPAYDTEGRITAANRPSGSPIDTKPGDWVFLAVLNEQLLDKEIKLSNDRMTWMTASQTILFAAFCLLLINKKALSENSEIVVRLATLIVTIIPFVAIFAIGCSMAGIFAAQSVGRRLEQERSFYQAALSDFFQVKIPDLGSQREGRWFRLTRVFGILPSFVIPTCFLIVWGIIILGPRLI